MKRLLTPVLVFAALLVPAGSLLQAADAAPTPAASAPAKAPSPAATPAPTPAPPANTPSAAEPAGAFALADPDHLLAPTDAQALDRRLAGFARATGHRIIVQLVAHAPPDTDGRKINAHVETLATSLGLAKDGVLVFYSADRDEWKLWLGDALLPAVMGRPGTAADFTPDGALHARKDALLAPAAKISADKTQPADRRLALASDALLSTLLPALEKK